MRLGPRSRVLAVAAGVLLAVSTVATVDAAPPEPGERPWKAGASNMGMCSAFLGQTEGDLEPNARAEVNHLIQRLGFGLKNVGELYSVRAKQHENQEPALECVRR